MHMPDRRKILESIVSLPFWPIAAAGAARVKTSQWVDRAVMWRRVLDDRSFELATVSCPGDSYRVRGIVLISEADVPSRVDYAIECGTDWLTRRLDIRQVLGKTVTVLKLTADQGKWQRNGTPAPELDGCTDIDLGISPSTNALPINRLDIPVGESREIQAAWVVFPQCTVEPARQSYERLAAARYRYRSVASGFTAVIDVDDGGLPIDYSGIWLRVAAAAEMNAVRAFWHNDP